MSTGEETLSRGERRFAGLVGGSCDSRGLEEGSPSGDVGGMARGVQTAEEGDELTPQTSTGDSPSLAGAGGRLL